MGGIKALSLYATGQSGLTLPLHANISPGYEVCPSSTSPLLPQVREPAGECPLSHRTFIASKISFLEPQVTASPAHLTH